MDMVIEYSRGVSRFDNHPEIRTAANFSAFAEAILGDRAPRKGMQYFCAAFNLDGRRSNDNCLPRLFNAMDIDRVKPERLPELREWFRQFSGFGYVTASSTPTHPRERTVLALSRPVSREEGIRIN